MNSLNPAVAQAVENSRTIKAINTLMGILAGITADGQLHDQEIHFLNTWLAENRQVVDTWPGNAVARAVRMVLADGHVDDSERAHLMAVLTSISGSDFAMSGSVSPEVADLPIEDSVTVRLAGSTVCFTGQFIFGTRPACERLAEKAGAIPVPRVSKKLNYLVIGTRVNPSWRSSSFGSKIQDAMVLQERGCELEIISETRWLDAMTEKLGAQSSAAENHTTA